MSKDVLYAEIRKLRDENADLRARVHLFETGAKVVNLEFPIAWGLNNQECALLSLLMKYDVVAYDRICVALWGEGADGAKRRHISVLATRLRSKLPNLNLKSLYNLGLHLCESNKRAIEQARVAEYAVAAE